MKPGFTLIELLVVIGLLTIISLFSVPFLFDSVNRSQLQTATWDIVDTLRRAQSQAVSGLDDTDWSVRVEAQQLVIFPGSTYNISDPENFAVAIHDALTITGISLNGGGADITFSARKGQTQQYGTITISDDNSGQNNTVTINQAGLIY